MSAPVTRIHTVYGDRYYVSSADLSGAKRYQLPIYTRAGHRWSDTPAGERAIRRNEATTVVRDNIIGQPGSEIPAE